MSENPTEFHTVYGYGYRLPDGSIEVGRTDMPEEITRAFVRQHTERIKRERLPQIPPEMIVRQVVYYPWKFEDKG